MQRMLELYAGESSQIGPQAFHMIVICNPEKVESEKRSQKLLSAVANPSAQSSNARKACVMSIHPSPLYE